MSTYMWSVFIAVVDQGSFVRAANVLNVSQSAVSHTISNLEEECGYNLLIRNRNGIQLTSNGKRLMPFARKLLNCEKSLEEEKNNLKEIKSGVVTIAAFHSATILWLPAILRNFKNKYPYINVIVRQSGDNGIYQMIQSKSVDLAFASKEAVPNDVTFIPLHQTALLAISSKEYTPINGHSITIDDFRNNKIILPYEGYDTEMIKFFHQYGLTAEDSYRIEDDDTLIAMVEQGFGLSLMPTMTIRCSNRNVNESAINIKNNKRIIGLVSVYSEYISPAANLFRKEILDYANKNGIINI